MANYYTHVVVQYYNYYFNYYYILLLLIFFFFSIKYTTTECYSSVAWKLLNIKLNIMICKVERRG